MTPDNARHRRDLSTEKMQWEATKIGGYVPIVYIRSDPNTFYLVGQEPTDAKLSFMRAMFRVGLVCLALTLGLLVWQWPRSKDDGGAPASRVAPTPMPPAPISRPLGREGPPVFGKRR